MNSRRKQVLVIGAGFAGIHFVRELKGRKDVDITLVDQRNYHLFQPLLYQVAMAGLSPADIAIPVRSIFGRRSGVQVLMAKLQRVNLGAKQAIFDFGTLSYDYLVLACGSEHGYFGRNEWEEFAPGLKTLEQATELRRRILVAFEMAEQPVDSELRKALLTFVVVGGGPTGVELAGALGEICRFTLRHEFRRVHSSLTRIFLVEAGDRVLPSFSPKSSASAQKDLESLGVTVLLNHRVIDVRPDGVRVKSSAGETWIETRTAIWAAGVEPSAVNSTLGVALDERGRIKVEPDLSLKEHPEIFVLGDQAHFAHGLPQPLAAMAPMAIQQGRWAANNLLRDLKGKARTAFRFFDKGQMATIGRSRAVLESGRFRASGLLAWLIWVVVHIFYLIGFRNRILVMMNWVYAYFTWKKGAQLIVTKEWRTRTPRAPST